MKKVLVIGPSDIKSHGGMATVIGGMKNSRILNESYCMDFWASYIDGNIIKRLLYSIYSYVKFLFIYKNYELFHIHVASFGSTFRKRMYLKRIKKAGKKAIVHIHGAKYLIFFTGLNKSGKKKVIDFLKSADMVIALSDDWKEKFEKSFGLTNCVSLPNGIDVSEFEEAVCDIVETRNTFVFLGRLGERKGAYDLVEAMGIAVKENPNLKLVMAGDGENGKVKAIIERKRLRKSIETVGWIEGKEKIEFLKKASTVVLPSYNEGLPMAVLEGMASGKAIISTTVGAIPEVVKEENGILIQPGDVQALADALVKCSTDVEMIKRMSYANLKKINQEFSMTKMHEMLKAYYDKVL